jgi:hypothetical protein
MAQSGIDPQMLAAITQSVLQVVSTMPQVVQNNGNQLSGSADSTQLSTAAKSDSTCGIQKDSAGAALEGSAAPQEEDGTVSEDGESDAPDDDEDKEDETEKRSGKQSGKKKNLNTGKVAVGKNGGRKGKRANEEGDAASKPLKKKKGENSNGDGDHGLSGTEAEGSAPVAVGQKGSDTVRTTRSSVGAAMGVQAAPPGETVTKKPRGRPKMNKSNGTPAPDEGVQVRVPSVMIDYHSYCMLCNKVESISTRLDELMGKVDMLLRRPSRSPPPGNHHTYGYHHGMPQYNHGMPHASSSSFIPQHNNQYQDATPHG